MPKKAKIPHMEKSSKREKEETTITTQDKLHQQYNLLQQQWDSIITQTKPTRRKSLRRSLSTDSTLMAKAFQLLNSSPRNLMYSLQVSPSNGGVGAWKVRNNDFGVEEILRERRAAIESGKLKGRRLFDADDEDIIMFDEGWDVLAQESEVRSLFSYDSNDIDYENNDEEHFERKEMLLSPVIPCDDQYCCSCSSSSSSTSSFLCDECMEKEVAAVEEEEKKVVVLSGKEEKVVVERRMVVKFWLAIGLLVCVIGTCISMRWFGGFGEYNEVTLVPT